MKQSILKLFFINFALVTSLFLPAAITLSAAEVDLLQQLSPEQRSAALKVLEKGSAPGSKANNKPLSEPKIVAPRAVENASSQLEKEAVEALDMPKLTSDKEKKTVKQKLKQFGYDLFAGSPSTFAPATDIPVPYDYVIGPGDTINIQLFGKENTEYNLVVTREGVLQFPGIGPIPVAGQRFEELKNNLNMRISRQMIGVQASITMGRLRSIRIFVLGDAYRPGSYTVSSLSTMTNALFVSGGIKPIGSLRNIELKRSGKLITRLDLYDLLLTGNTSGDVRLQPGDVIFIPPIGSTVGIAGEVRRPAIYELREEKTVDEVLKFAGGLLPTAYPQVSQLERINELHERELIDLNLTDPSSRNTILRDGDILRVYSVLEKMDNVVLLSGRVYRPGGYQWNQGMRLTDIIPSMDKLLPESDLDYVLIKRQMLPDRRISVLSARLRIALQDPDSPENVALRPRDEVIVFGMAEDRSKTIASVILQLRQQAGFSNPEPVVTIQGNIRYPGTYPLEDNMRLSDLVRAGLDILPESDLDYALVVREYDNGARIVPFSVSLGKALNNPGGKADILLAPRDKVYVFSLVDDRQKLIQPELERLRLQARQTEPARLVNIQGFVKAPGQYPFEDGIRVSRLVQAGGGLEESAYRLEAELTRYNIDKEETRLTEHVAVDLERALAGDAEADLKLMPHDTLHIKKLPLWSEQQLVEIQGEVRFPGVYLLSRGETLRSLINRAGGFTELAFLDGAVFMREKLRQKEQKQIDALAEGLESDLAAVSLEKTQTGPSKKGGEDSYNIMRSLASQLRATKAVGRLVIDLKGIVEGDGEDIVLAGGDKLVVPVRSQEVTVIGEVHFPTSHLYNKNFTRDDYINMSGGITYKAKEKHIYIVRANGTVIAGNSSGWFKTVQKINPGDTIVVPLNAERIRPLTLVTNISQIIYQLGLAMASWYAIGVL